MSEQRPAYGRTEKKIHFRIIELPEYQVLLTKDFDEESEESTPLLVISFFHEGMKLDLKLGYSDESKIDKLIETFTSEDAQTLIDNTLEQFKE